ncbi:hypothetical protein HDU82_009322 [Entophlyctis luteolus]|nr:hypothetical protein HDU82_009322 [Entophlyctis luteolus]
MAANAHLGHSVADMHPNMLSFVHGSRAGICILNLDHTLSQLRRACNLARDVAREPRSRILFVGTRRAIHRITVDAAMSCAAGFTTKWIGGTLTNRERVLRRSVRFDPDTVSQKAFANIGGSVDGDGGDGASGGEILSRQPIVPVPDLVVVLDMKNNMHAVRESNQLNIPIIAITDSDCDPALVQYPIAANDDSLSSVRLIAGLLARSIREGRLRAANA